MSGGLSAEIIKEVQQVLGCVLPEPLLNLYRDRDTTAEASSRIGMRLMPPDEVVNFHQIVQDEDWGGLATKEIRVFWTDDNSNFTGLYVTGPLEGKLCFINHEEVDLSPVHASVESFVDAMTAASPPDRDWRELHRDYPVETSADPQAVLRDWKIAQSFRPLYEASQYEDRVYYAFCMMALTPSEQSNSLLTFTYDKNPYIQERACEILGQRRYEPAVDRLFEVARSGTHNGRTASIIALGKMDSDVARGYLRELLPILPNGYDIYVNAALGEASP